MRMKVYKKKAMNEVDAGRDRATPPSVRRDDDEPLERMAAREGRECENEEEQEFFVFNDTLWGSRALRAFSQVRSIDKV